MAEASSTSIGVGAHPPSVPRPPMFSVEKVELQYSVQAEFVAAQVANDILVLALSSGRILRIDLKHGADIEDIDLPRKAADVGVIRKLFLDPTASHLIVATAGGENFYLHAQSRTPRHLSRLRGVVIECVAWSPANPTSSTREILVGSRDGAVYETFIESSNEFYRRDEKYSKLVYKAPNSPVSGILIALPSTASDQRSVFIASNSQLIRIDVRLKRNGGDGSNPIYVGMSDIQPIMYGKNTTSQESMSLLSITPLATESSARSDSINQYIAWSSSQGIFQAPSNPALDEAQVASERHLISSDEMGTAVPQGSRGARSAGLSSMLLSQWHVLYLHGDRLVAFDLLTHRKVYDEHVLDPSDHPLSLIADAGTNTYWLFTSREIMEIVITDEDRDVWRVMLDKGDYRRALKFADSPVERDTVASSQGDALLKQEKYREAAEALGKSSAMFEDSCLKFLEAGRYDALRLYLSGRLLDMSKRLVMQRTMISTWLVELFMSALDETENQKDVEDIGHQDSESHPDRTKQSQEIQLEYQDFIRRFHLDLDRKAAYDIMQRHARDEELVFYAEFIDDYTYLLRHWSQREDWTETLRALGKQKKPELFYKYSTILMQHRPVDFVEILMRQPNLDQQMLIPAILAYEDGVSSSTNKVRTIVMFRFVIRDD